jgi:hypothetical protein
MSAARLQQDLRAALRARHERLKDASADHVHDEIRFAADWISTQPALRAILAEAAQAEPGLNFGRWEQQLRTPYQMPAWPCRTEAGRATLAWQLLQRIAAAPAGKPDSSDKRQRGLVLEYALGLSRADGNIHAMTRRFTDFIVTPLFEFLQEQAAAHASVLYVLERYVRRVEWFDRDDLYRRAMEDTRKAEQVYDADLRRFLFSEGISMPFSQPSSASGLSDVVAGLHTEDPLVCEVKIFDAAGRGRGHLASGVTQATQYTADYGQHAAYLLIINLSGRPLALPSDDDPKNWPPRITVAGTSVYLISVRALPVATASKLGKPAPVTISYDELVGPDL